MTMRIVVFPVNGRRWAFSAVVQAVGAEREQALTLGQLWQQLQGVDGFSNRTELATHFVADKMHAKWSALQEAPENSIRHRVYSMGQRLLSKLKPSESFLKAIPGDTEKVEIVYPRSVNPRLVRRRVRHIALSGTVVHQRLMYGSFFLLPFTAVLAVLPFPNLPLFWNLFRAHAHWRALQGSKRLESLVTNGSESSAEEGQEVDGGNRRRWVLVPSERLELLTNGGSQPAIEDLAIESICEEYHLDASHIMRWRDL